MRARLVTTLPVIALAILLPLVSGCALTVPSTRHATIDVTYTEASIAGVSSSRHYSVQQTTVYATTTSYREQRDTTSRTMTITDAERRRIDSLTRRALAARSSGRCSDSPSAALEVTWPNGDGRRSEVTYCGGQRPRAPLAGLVDYLGALD